MMQDIKRICDAPDRRGPRMVPRYRRARRTGAARPARRLGELSRRVASCGSSCRPKLIRKFRMFALSDKATESEGTGRGDPRRRGLSARALDAGRQLRRGGAAIPTSRSSTWICSATGRSSCGTRGATASASRTSAGTRRSATSAGSGATTCASRRRAGSACEPGSAPDRASRSPRTLSLLVPMKARRVP